MTIPLITSIPPRLSRRDRAGREIGEEYQTACIDSWRRLGFTVHSVNARSELDGMPRRPDVAYWAVERDASEITGRPLVWFDDLLGACREIADGPFVLTNADILLRGATGRYDETAALKPGTALIANRIDVADPADSQGTRIGVGYDLFGIHRDDLQEIDNIGIIFGCPWWDYFLPYIMIMRNMALIGPNKLRAFHLIQEPSWDHQMWMQIGGRFLDFVRAEADRSSPQFSSQLPQTIFRKTPISRRLFGRAERTKRKNLTHLAHALIGMVDRKLELG